MVMLVHKLRMTVRTKQQREALDRALEVSRCLYNAALEDCGSLAAKVVKTRLIQSN